MVKDYLGNVLSVGDTVAIINRTESNAFFIRGIIRGFVGGNSRTKADIETINTYHSKRIQVWPYKIINTQRRNEDYILLDSITVGKTEYVLGKLDSEKVDMWVTWAKDTEKDYFYWGHYFSEEAKAKKDLLDRATEALIPQIYNGAEKEKESSGDSAHKEGICPVCGGVITYGCFELVDEGGVYFWDCGTCGASGREGYDLVFDGSHYDVTLGDAVTKLDDIPAGHIAVMTVDSKTIQTLTPMLQCESLDYGANRICKNELLFSKTVEIGYGYSAELRVTAGSDGDPLNVNVWLLHDNELEYDYDGRDAILGTWTLENADGTKLLLVVKEGE